MTESLYCFKKGRKQIGEAGGIAFDKFFTESSSLKSFSGYGEEFYKNVRCGILHQGETYRGWKIQRKGALLDVVNRSINATKYLNALESELESFTEMLKTLTIKSKDWNYAIRKLDHICENCST